MRADTDRITENLDRLIADARTIKDQLHDLDYLAYEQQTNDEPHVTTTRTDYALDTTGNPQAKRVLRNVTRTAARAQRELKAELVGIFALFAGEGADTTLRGTTISRKTFDEQTRAQARRRKNPNDYVPTPIEQQPRYPKGSR